jgi:N-acetyl-anhydromuramyl-L-alanine amidase AmpD
MHLLDFLRRMFPMAQPPAEPAPAPAKSKPAGSPSSPTASAPIRYYPQSNRKTPNVSAGRVIKPTHIVLHHTSGAYAGSVSWCLDPISKVSYHCIVARNGKRTVLATPSQRTWHAGVSSWQGRKDANSFSIGMAWEGDTYQGGIPPSALG